MLLPESVDNMLKNPAVRFVAAGGFLVLLSDIISGFLFNLADLAGASFVFDRFLNLGYLELVAALIVASLWIALSISRRFEQPWWILVTVAVLVWLLIIEPITIELRGVSNNLFNIIALGLRAAGLLAGIAGLDRATPKQAPVVAIPQQAVPPMGQHVDHLSDPAPAQAQAQAQAAGWYPDPRQQATWRWWDGAGWTDNVG